MCPHVLEPIYNRSADFFCTKQRDERLKILIRGRWDANIRDWLRFFPPQNKKSGLYFYAKVREAPEKSWSEIAKKGHQKKLVPFVSQCWLRSWDLGYIEKLINDFRCSAKKCPGFYEYVP